MMMKFFWVISFVLAVFSAQAIAADPAAGESKAKTCVACHGANGNSTNADYPSLAAQTPLYIYYQLLQFREGRRSNVQMNSFAEKLSDDDMQDIAAYFSAQKFVANETKIDAAKIEAGKAVAAKNHCASCHMPNYSGQNHIPRLAGLNADYLLTHLRGFKTGARQDIDGTMASAAQPLSEKDMLDVAGYLASLK
jgi:cytochrome c553